MRDLQKRIAKLEQLGPQGKIHVVVVRAGQDPEEEWQKYLHDHPEAAQGKIAFFHTNVPEPDPLPAEFA